MIMQLTYPDSAPLPEETDYKTLQVIDGIAKLKQLGPKIQECKTVKDVNHIKTNCQLIQTYARERKLDQELVHWAQCCALKCSRKIGEILMAMKERRELRGKGQPRKSILPDEKNTFVTISDLELTEKESSNAQVLATVSEEQLEQVITEETKNGKLSTQAVVKKIREAAQETKPRVLPIRHRTVSDKFPLYWTQERKLLEQFFKPADLEKLPELWEKNFSIYLADKKAKIEQAKATFHP
jgi:hypothetical protein